MHPCGWSGHEGIDAMSREMKQQQARSDAEQRHLRERVMSLERALADANTAITQDRRMAQGALLCWHLYSEDM